MKKLNSDQWLGLSVFVFALVLLFIWIPLDTETGMIENVRRRNVIGDAMAPSVTAVVLLIGAVLTWFKPDADAPRLTIGNLKWLASLAAIFILSLAVMRYLGPALGAALTDTGYRPLRDTLPWKYLGFVAGGTIMVALLSGISQSRSVFWLVIIGVVAALVIALAYDLPFDDLLLPPNGDI
mgnify:CR=1 FL=1